MTEHINELIYQGEILMSNKLPENNYKTIIYTVDGEVSFSVIRFTLEYFQNEKYPRISRGEVLYDNNTYKGNFEKLVEIIKAIEIQNNNQTMSKKDIKQLFNKLYKLL